MFKCHIVSFFFFVVVFLKSIFRWSRILQKTLIFNPLSLVGGVDTNLVDISVGFVTSRNANYRN